MVAEIPVVLILEVGGVEWEEEGRWIETGREVVIPIDLAREIEIGREAPGDIGQEVEV